MKKIGKGWQYTVYDMGNGRVRKVFNTKAQAYLIFLKECFPYTKFPLWKFSNLYENMKIKAITSLSWIRQSEFDRSLLGNPLIKDDLNFEQDLVTPLDFYLKKISPEEGRKIIDKFVTLSKFFIEKKVIDKSFLIGKNYGITREGKLILTDIGELFIGKDKVMRQLRVRPWDHPYVKKTIPVELRDYFIKEMDKNLLPVSE